MAARLWRWVLVGALLLSAAAGAAITHVLALPWPAAVALSLGTLFAIPVAGIACTFASARILASADGAAADTFGMLRAFGGEISACWLSILAMVSTRPSRMTVQGPVAPNPRPVMLLHGILCNHGVWSALRVRLRAAGIEPVDAPDMEPLFAPIELQSNRIARRLVDLQLQSGGRRVAIIAHSMGGLVARALLRDLGPGVIDRIITLGSPHHGTLLVRGMGGSAATDMARASPWLRELNAAQDGRLAIPFTSIYTLHDNLVVPADSATLRGARLLALRGVGHLALLRSRHSLDLVMAALGAEPPA